MSVRMYGYRVHQGDTASGAVLGDTASGLMPAVGVHWVLLRATYPGFLQDTLPRYVSMCPLL